VVDAARGFVVIAGAWVRAALTYRTSFVIMVLVQVVITFLDFAAILIMFSHLDAFGGFTLPQIALLFAMSGFALGAADLLVGNSEALGRRIRDGSFDQMLVRPVAPIVQVAADRFAIRRVGRIAQALGVLTWALLSVSIDWTVGRVVVLVGAMLCGSVIFCAVFVMGGAFQVFAAALRCVVHVGSDRGIAPGPRVLGAGRSRRRCRCGRQRRPGAARRVRRSRRGA